MAALVALGVLHEHTDEIWCVEWSPSGRWLASGSKDRAIILWSLRFADGAGSAPELTAVHKLGGHPACAPSALSWSPDGRRLLSCGLDDCCVKLWDRCSGALVRDFRQHAAPVSSVAWLSDGRRFVTGGAEKRAALWCSATGEELRRWGGVRVHDIKVSPRHVEPGGHTQHPFEA